MSHRCQGHNIRLDELGTSPISLAVREVTDRREIHVPSVEIKKVNFSPVPDLMKRVLHNELICLKLTESTFIIFIIRVLSVWNDCFLLS